MSKINQHNYEAFLLDYIEGNLPLNQVAELMLFLEQNPEIKEELEDFEDIRLTPEVITFQEKEGLKNTDNTINMLNCEDIIIAEIEGQNNQEQSKELRLFLAENPEKKAELEGYKKTKIIAPAIVYPDKEQLLRKDRKIIPLYWWVTSAAAIILALFILKGLTGKEEKLPQQIVNNIKNSATEENKELIEQDIIEKEKPLIVKNNEHTEKEKQIVKKEIEKSKKILKQHNKNNRVLAKNEPDSALIKNDVPEIKEEEIIEEPQYADDVKITYEEEVTEKAEKKKSVLGTIFNSQIKDKVLKQDKDENGDVTAYAINVGSFSFSRKRRK